MQRWLLVPAVLVGVAGVAAAVAVRDPSSAEAPLRREEAPDAATGTSPPPDAAPPPTFVPLDPECPAVPARALPDPARPRYEVEVDVDPAAGTVTGTLGVRFAPDADVERLVLRLWANGPRPSSAGARIAVEDATVDGETVGVALPDPTTLVLELPATVPAGRPIEAAMAFHLEVPGSAADRISNSGGALRLGSFLPLLAWEPGLGWAEDPPTSGFAEATSTPTADWSVRISVPEGYDVLATGRPGRDGRWEARSARDYALSVGHFSTATATVEAPHPVEVTVGVHDGIAEDPQAYLDRVTDALTRLAAWYGPYPWDTYQLAITPELRGGIEFPAHVMQGPGSLGRTTPHEVAHMWFYGLVGNNQARYPWLDEGLATWAEGRLEGTLQDMAAREIPAAGRGRAGEPMTFWEVRQDAYFRSVYVQPAAALASLAAPERIDCALAHYVAEHAHRLATPDDLVAALRLVVDDPVAALEPFGVP